MNVRKSTSLYAAYGSNLHPRRLRERIRSAKLRGTSFLHKYTLQFHKRGQDRSAKCGFSDCGQGMHVAVYEVDNVDRKTLDAIEGVGKGYDVDEISVPALVVSTRHDPMVFHHTVRPALRECEAVETVFLDRGGHVGFPEGVTLGWGDAGSVFAQTIRWLERHGGG